MAPRVLLLDPPTRLSRELEAALEGAGLDVLRALEASEAVLALRGEDVDVALVERSLGTDELLGARGDEGSGAPLILFDDFGTAEEARRARAAGVFEVLARPLPNEVVLQAVRRALEQSALLAEREELRHAVQREAELAGLATADDRMRQVFETVHAVAETDATLLLAGESGVGKTRLARTVHQRSHRAEGPFVEVNCGALPEALLESELFGHKKGAFTGAVGDRRGKFEAAHTGTLFLDEIATATHALQVKLLRVLESHEFEPVGDERTRKVDVRLIVATNRDLRAEVEAGRFREDLFYRINVVAVEVPPLRERPADIPLLAERFVHEFAARHGREAEELTPDALRALTQASWEGNVRELENTIERAVLLSRGRRVERGDLGPDFAAPANPGSGAEHPHGDFQAIPLGPLKVMLAVPERAFLLRALETHRGSRTRAAKTLGINRTTLFNKMRKYDLLSFPAQVDLPEEERPSGS